MPLTTRTVAGTLKDANGSLLSSVTIELRPSSFYGDDGVLIVPEIEIVTTDGFGAYTVNLVVPDVGFVTYHCSILSAKFNFDLTAGAATSLDDLYNLGAIVGSGSSLALLLAAKQDLIEFRDEGVMVGSAATVDFVGAGVNATLIGSVLQVSIPGGGGGAGSINFSAGTASQNLSNIVFSNSNGISFGLNGSTVTGSHNALTSQSVQTQNLVSVLGSTGNISFANSNGITFGGNNSTVTASHNGLTSQSEQTQNIIQAIRIGGDVFSSGTVRFSNSNGISFGTVAGQTITASHDGITLQSNQVLSAFGVSNTTLGTSGSIDARSLSFQGAGAVSVGISNGSVVISGETAAGGGISNINLSAGTTSQNLSAFTVANSNGMSFGLNGSVLTGTVATNYQSQGAYLTTAMQSNAATISNVKMSAGTLSTNRSDFTFGNSNGISFGLETNGIFTGTVKTDYQTSGNYLTTAMLSNAATISNINLSGGTTSQNLSKFEFNNANGVSFGLNGSTITASVAAAGGAQTGISGISGGTTLMTSGTASFADSNGVSWGVNGNTITATVATNYQSQGAYLTTAMLSNAATISNINVSGGTTSNNLSNIVFSNSNGVSFGLNGSTITGTVATNYQSQGAYLTTAMQSNAATISNVNLSAGTTSNNLSAFVFSNSNGVSFGLNGSTVTGSHNALTTQTNQNLSLFGLGNTTQNSSTVLNASVMSLNGLGGMTVGYSNGSIQLSAPQTVAQSNQNISWFGLNQTTQNSSTVLNASAISLAGRGIVTVGYSNGSIQISATEVAQTNQNMSLFALGNTTQNSSTLLNASNMSFNAIGAATMGFSNGSIQVSVPVQTAQTQSNIQAIYDGANSISTGTIRYSNLNGISFGINGQTLTGSHNGITSQSNQNISLFALGNTTQNSSTLLNASNLSLNGLGIITAGFSNGSIQLSASQSNQQLSMYAVSNTSASSSGTGNASALSFQGAGIASVGVSNGSVLINVPAGAPSPVNFSAGTTSNNLGSVVFSNSNGVSFGLNGSTITASVAAAGGGIALANSQTTYTSGTAHLSVVGGAMTIASTTGQSFNFSVPQTSSLSAVGPLTITPNGSTISFSAFATTYNSSVFGKQLEWAQSSSSLGQNSVFLWPEVVHDYVCGSVLKMPVMLTVSSSAAAAQTRGYTMEFGVYTRNATNSTVLSRHYSTSYTASVSQNSNGTLNIGIITGVQNSTSYNTLSASSAGVGLSASVHGAREFIVPWNSTIAPGEYWFALRNSSSSAGVAGSGFQVSHIIGSSSTQNRLGLSINSTNPGIAQNIGMGVYSATSGALPAGISMTQINQSGLMVPMFFLCQTQ
jgi:hypothetical protein